MTSCTSRLTAQKMKFSIKYFFSKCDQLHSFLQIWSHLPKKSLMKNFISCAVSYQIAGFFDDQYLLSVMNQVISWFLGWR